MIHRMRQHAEDSSHASAVTRSSFHFHLCTTFLFFEHHNVYSPSLGSLGDRQGYCYDFPHSFSFYVIVYLHFFGHLFYILIYDYSSTVCLLRRLFMHCSCAYSCAYIFIHSMLTHAQPYCTVQYIRTEWTLLFCS